MADSISQIWSPLPMVITVTDTGQSLQVSNVDRWIEERKQLLRRARDLIKNYDGNPRSLYSHHGELMRIATRLAQIKVIFDTYNHGRARHADANIIALVEYINDPKTMEGVDD